MTLHYYVCETAGCVWSSDKPSQRTLIRRVGPRASRKRATCPKCKARLVWVASVAENWIGKFTHVPNGHLIMHKP